MAELPDWLRRHARRAGRRLERTRKAFREGRERSRQDRPDADRIGLGCRRHADRRVVDLDGAGRPACFEAGHPDCEGCLDDIEAGRLDTWVPGE
ncbi:MAG: hypothetical protein ABEJ86_07205 [Halococcoides sp.]